MGTMLYARGVFINRCFDSLNIMSADTVTEIHQDYVRAGADVIETNTFGANRIKLRSFGSGDQRARDQRRGRAHRPQGGARRRRMRAPEPSVRSASASSHGARWAPTKPSRTSASRPQALVEGGVDLFILETFRDLNEMGAAIRGSSQRLVAADRGADDDRGRRQQPRRDAARSSSRPRWSRRGADVIGVNCSIGPAHDARDASSGWRRVTRARLSAQPNAGRPRDIEGRNIYLSSPEYMASYARRFRAAGRPARRRMLRHDAGAHPPDQGRDQAGQRRQIRRVRKGAPMLRRDSWASLACLPRTRHRRRAPSRRAEKSQLAACAGGGPLRHDRRAPAAERVCRRRHHRAGARAEDPRRGRRQHPGRAAWTAHERARARGARAAEGRHRDGAAVLRVATGTCSACSRTCSARTRWASATSCS